MRYLTIFIETRPQSLLQKDADRTTMSLADTIVLALRNLAVLTWVFVGGTAAAVIQTKNPQPFHHVSNS